MKTKLIFILVIFLAGCSGLKKTSKSEVKSDIKTNTEVSKNTQEKETGSAVDKTKITGSIQNNKSLETIEKETIEWESRLITYDTNKPIDSVTRKPPVASELVQTNKINKDKKATESSETMLSMSEVKDVVNLYTKEITKRNDSLSQVISSLKSEASTKEQPVNNWWKWLLTGIAISGIAFCIWYFKLWKLLI